MSSHEDSSICPYSYLPPVLLSLYVKLIASQAIPTPLHFPNYGLTGINCGLQPPHSHHHASQVLLGFLSLNHSTQASLAVQASGLPSLSPLLLVVAFRLCPLTGSQLLSHSPPRIPAPCQGSSCRVPKHPTVWPPNTLLNHFQTTGQTQYIPSKSSNSKHTMLSEQK